ncbi:MULTISPECIES: RluA family pseudouridine synthase [Acetobacter]|jgi:23S rRNA pseudouridine955/2504/2580 synthase|uniref:Pseudouridine synthase n=1 Tax=Acetobacter lovaniensis TaxID=104100 RepID=A0A841QDN6_9PROT|nr:RluA family pseudouridine synthase [Acetobacter lovaniensis]MBB6456518.1 23S rRNA pseudouridine955/2504/2580 synthase [Acetobacter lovaniensis]MCI1698039.1 RluA family pseudouridine synthase [Acetobacter lovaniensis]MCI1796448.1 RluA family pseudouridine synthase [Acetobacter lovaniensis]MCP1238832.1 RluA family pseudouridine synthase [Acetobacter lovaniensis]NHN80881.1 RluA family pseudouridine synthase [Acetobacter lovaniensis]
MSVVNLTVSEDEAGIRLDRYFRRHYPHLTQGALQKLCRTGQIRVEGKRVEASTRLEPGQSVRVPPIPMAAKPARDVPRPLDDKLVREIQRMVVYQDKHLIVLNKPSGLAVQGGPGITRHVDMMLDGLRENPDDPRPRLVHRIDRDTSGLLLLARTPGVAAKLAASFRGRDVKKTYWAVVVGRPDPLSGEIDQPLARLGVGPGAITVAADRKDEDAQSARTVYEVLDSAARKFSWLGLSPLTGRTHQLRVHCESLGTPILGDPKYGGATAHPSGFTDQLHLHARELDMPHPAGGRLVVSAELPAHMRETFRALGFTPGTTPPPARKGG